MITYKQLTKKVTDANGNQMIVCRFHGTEECQIHKPNGCNNCQMFNAIINQLNIFEEIYIGGDDDEHGKKHAT